MPLPWLIAGGIAAAAAAIAMNDDPKENKQNSKDHARTDLAPNYIREGTERSVAGFKADLDKMNEWYAVLISSFDKEMQEKGLDIEIIKKKEKFHKTILENKGTLYYRKKQCEDYPQDVYLAGLVKRMEELFKEQERLYRLIDETCGSTQSEKDLAPKFIREWAVKSVTAFEADLHEMNAEYATIVSGLDKKTQKKVLDQEMIKKQEAFHEIVLKNKDTLDRRKEQGEKYPQDAYLNGLIERMEYLFKEQEKLSKLIDETCGSTQSEKDLAPKFIREWAARSLTAFEADLDEMNAEYAIIVSGLDKKTQKKVLDQEMIKKQEAFHEIVLKNKDTLDRRKEQGEKYLHDAYLHGLIEKMESLFKEQEKLCKLIDDICDSAKKEKELQENLNALQKKMRQFQENINALQKETEKFRGIWLRISSRIDEFGERKIQFQDQLRSKKRECDEDRNKWKSFVDELESMKPLQDEQALQKTLKDYKEKLDSIEKLYEEMEKSFEQTHQKYIFIEQQEKIFATYENDFLPQLQKLADQVEACIGIDQQDIWDQKDAEIAKQVKALESDYKRLQNEMKGKPIKSAEEFLRQNKGNDFFTHEIEHLQRKQKGLREQCQTQMSQFENGLKTLRNKNMIDEPQVPAYDAASGKEIVYLEYKKKFRKTILKRNGENVHENLLNQVETMSINEWFEEDDNWEGLPKKLADQINDDFEVQFRGSEADYQKVKAAFKNAELDGFVCTVKRIGE